jgi:hypothetical protein
MVNEELFEDVRDVGADQIGTKLSVQLLLEAAKARAFELQRVPEAGLEPATRGL